MKKLIMCLFLISCVLVFSINVSANSFEIEPEEIIVGSGHILDNKFNGKQYRSVDEYLCRILGRDTLLSECKDKFLNCNSPEWFCSDNEDMWILGGAHNINNKMHGGPGNDKLLGHGGDDILLGGLGDDKLYGHEGDDYLFGGKGLDYLYGGVGDDVLINSEGDYDHGGNW